MDKLYNDVCRSCSMLVTKKYSTSFSLGIRVFSPQYRPPIYSIYGFVRLADEIVDTFHESDKKYLLEKFRKDTHEAVVAKISLNPILNSFQEVVNKYNIEKELIDAFLDSMEMDLQPVDYNEEMLKKYIYGSAEVVGLMCLKVFCTDAERYNYLKEYACALGSAFQKINFLRDIKSDYLERGRTYFPGLDFLNFNEEQKRIIENDIENEFKEAYIGIKKLPKGVRFGVYLAYRYYMNLFYKIKRATPKKIMTTRMRVRNRRKIYLLATSAVRNSLNML